MGRRDGVGSFSDKVTLRAVRGARQMSWGFLLQVYLGRRGAHRYESIVGGHVFQAIWHEKTGRDHLEPRKLRGFPFPSPCHEFVNGFSRRLPMMQNSVHLSGNWHLHLMDTR